MGLCLQYVRKGLLYPPSTLRSFMTEFEIRLGSTDGGRYIGVKPPLEGHQIEDLKTITSGWSVEQVTSEPQCTLFRTSSEIQGPRESTLRMVHTSEAIAETLRNLGNIVIESTNTIFKLMGHQSSPFNPNTDRVNP
jgi:hypothetical protein